MANNPRPMIDYNSLVSLSNSSRSDAIHTIDQLSQRLSSSTSLLREERRAKSYTSSGSSTGHGKRRPRPKETRHGDKTDIREHESTLTGPKPSRTQGSAPHKSASHPTEHKKTLRKSHSSHTRRSSNGSDSTSTLRSSDIRSPNRISFVSVSSDSTKLGEMPRRRSRLVRVSEDGYSGGYALQPVYPLHPYAPAQRERGGFLKRIFGRRDKE